MESSCLQHPMSNQITLLTSPMTTSPPKNLYTFLTKTTRPSIKQMWLWE